MNSSISTPEGQSPVQDQGHSTSQEHASKEPSLSAHSLPSKADVAQGLQGMLNTWKAQRWLWVFCLAACLGCLLLWQKLSGIEAVLARQSANTSELAQEAKALAKESSELSRDTAAHLALTDNKLSEVALQRAQLEALMQSLSRTRDENFLDDLESSLHLAQQQVQMTGSVQPLLETLRIADQKIAKLSQPRLSALAGAIKHDLNQLKSISLSDTPNLLIQIDHVVKLLDDMPLLNDVKKTHGADLVQPNVVALTTTSSADRVSPSWMDAIVQREFKDWVERFWASFKGLVRVSVIDNPQAIMVSPEQGFFIRENLKLRLLNAKLALLSRQTEVARLEVEDVEMQMKKYFDLQNKNSQVASAQIERIKKDLGQQPVPRLDETLSALLNAQVSH